MYKELALHDMVFPVFKLRAYNSLETVDGITYVESYYGTTILDNKNLAGDTLGARRLRITKPLYSLKHKLDTISDLASQKLSKATYIDTEGKIFTYKKSNTLKLTYHKVISIKCIEGVGISIQVSGVCAPIIVSSRVHILKYIGLLHWLGGYLIYDFSNVPKKKTTRKI